MTLKSPGNLIKEVFSFQQFDFQIKKADNLSILISIF